MVSAFCPDKFFLYPKICSHSGGFWHSWSTELEFNSPGFQSWPNAGRPGTLVGQLPKLLIFGGLKLTFSFSPAQKGIYTYFWTANISPMWANSFWGGNTAELQTYCGSQRHFVCRQRLEQCVFAVPQGCSCWGISSGFYWQARNEFWGSLWRCAASSALHLGVCVCSLLLQLLSVHPAVSC